MVQYARRHPSFMAFLVALTVCGVAVANEIIRGVTSTGTPTDVLVDSSGNVQVEDAAAEASLAIIDDWDETDRAKVNIIAGQVGVAAGSGASSALTQRVIAATDSPEVTAVQIMDDWDETDRAKVNIIAGQVGVAANSGATDALTQRVIAATNSPEVTALEIMDDWDSSDTAKVTIAAQTATALVVSATAAANTKANPIYVARGYQDAAIDDDLVAGSINLAASSTSYTLPAAGDAYMVCARGNRAYVECGTAVTVTTSAGGYVFSVPDGACVGPLRLTGPDCAHIASSAVGQIEFIRFVSP